MDITGALFLQCAVMFALMGVGLLLYRAGMISDGTAKDLGAILLNLVFPIVIVRSFWGQYSPERATILPLIFVASLAALALAVLIARVCFRTEGVGEFSAAFSNAGFIGIPLVQAAFGSEAVFYIACFIAQVNVLQWTYGMWRLSKSTAFITPKAIVTSPMFLGLVIGIALFLLRAPVPAFCMNIMETIANLNTPLAMIVLGTYLAKSNPRNLFLSSWAYRVSAIRLVIIPLVTVALLAQLPCDLEIRLAILIAAAAPTGANVAIFCQQLGLDTKRASDAVCLTTLISLVTIPAITTLATCLLV